MGIKPRSVIVQADTFTTRPMRPSNKEEMTDCNVLFCSTEKRKDEDYDDVVEESLMEEVSVCLELLVVGFIFFFFQK